jgi:hypothetical protein
MLAATSGGSAQDSSSPRRRGSSAFNRVRKEELGSRVRGNVVLLTPFAQRLPDLQHQVVSTVTNPDGLSCALSTPR